MHQLGAVADYQELFAEHFPETSALQWLYHQRKDQVESSRGDPGRRAVGGRGVHTDLPGKPVRDRLVEYPPGYLLLWDGYPIAPGKLIAIVGQGSEGVVIGGDERPIPPALTLSIQQVDQPVWTAAEVVHPVRLVSVPGMLSNVVIRGQNHRGADTLAGQAT